MTWKISPVPAAAATNLLNVYPGAIGAFSLRRLVNNATGPVVRVRRSSDDAEADFTAEQVTNGSLTTFCGAGNGFVRTWYDQSGNGNHASQWSLTAQPLIVSSGSLITVSAKPAISFNATTARLVAVRLIGQSRLDTYIVKNTSDITYNLFNSTSQYSWTASNTLSTTIVSSYGTSPLLFANNVQFAGTTRQDVYNFLNGYKLEVHQASATAGWTNFNISAVISGFEYVGTIQELVFYASDQSANRIGIQNNINAYYGIY